MKHRLSLAIVAGLVLAGLVAWAALAAEGADSSEAESAATSTFHVTVMTCGGCEV